MKILVGFASKYGATDGIAAQIAAVLAAAGHDVTLSPLDSASVTGHDAFVLGSAIYAGSWLKSARLFVEVNREALAEKPVWLFSSGPIGDPAKPEGEPQGVTAIKEVLKAREHRIFSGRLDKERLNRVERAVASASNAEEGDFRDWAVIRVWAERLAHSLPADRPPAPRPKLNWQWHQSHPMPPHPSWQQRMAWHLEHQNACACRPMPEKLVREMEALPKG
jgi:menaquinone-dependent protoporphyrinogen oxidase